MALRRNIVANYVGQALTAALGIVFVPVYIHYLTIEAYALVGIFALLQGWLILFDLGMTPTLGREMALYAGGATSVQTIRDLLRSLEVGFAVLGLAAAGAIAIAARYLAHSWFHTDHLAPTAIADALRIMSVVVALRFGENIYRSALIGLQQQVWYNSATVVLTILRNVGAVAILAFVSPTVEAFFLWQGTMSIVTLAAMGAKLYFGLPAAPRPARFSPAALVAIRGFAGGMIMINILAFLSTQIDKILLSRLLPLDRFGYYVLASSVAGMIFLVAAPIAQAIYPAFVRQSLDTDRRPLSRTYHSAAQGLGVLVSPVAALLIAYPHAILFLWTNDAVMTGRTATLLAVLVLANYVNAVLQVPLQLQLALGQIQNLIISLVAGLVVLLPTLLWAVPRYGAIAAALVWLAANLLHLPIQLPLLHRRTLQGEGWTWAWRSVVMPMVGPVVVLAVALVLKPDGVGDRLDWLLFLPPVALLAMAASVTTTASTRQRLSGAVRVVYARRVARSAAR